MLPTPNGQRIASGAAGTGYWQNTADYVIDAELDDVKRSLSAKATVTYHNASPDTLDYLWVQLDQNYFAHDADMRAVPNTKRGIDPAKVSYAAVDRLLAYEEYDGALKISSLTDATGKELDTGRGSAILEHPLNAVIWLAQDLKQAGIVLKPGDLLSLGSFSRLLPPQPGTTVRAVYEGLPGTPSVSVRFR